MIIPSFLRRSTTPLLVAMVVLAGCAGTAPLQTATRATDIRIDGSESDWYEHLRPVDRRNMSMAVLNDDEFLYVGLMTSDPMLVHQMTSRGMMLWIDPSGGRTEEIGLQFPLGLLETSGNTPLPRTREAYEELFARSILDMELIREGGQERMRLPANTIPGVGSAVSLRNGTLFYEVRLPLRETGAYTFAVGSAPGQTVGLGIGSAEIDPEVRRRELLEGAANSPMQGGGTYGNPYGYGGYGGPTPDRRAADDAVRIWRRVALVE